MRQSVEVVAPELHSAAARLADAAQRLKDGLSSVDDETTQLLGSGWQGGAASAYQPVWEKWHGGAEQVVTGLQRMSELLTIAAKEYVKTDESASDALGSTVQGSGGSAGGDCAPGGESGRQGAGQDSAGQVGGGAGASQSAEGLPGSTSPSSSASQLGQVAAQPLSQAGQMTTGVAQAIAGLAQQARQLATEATQRPETKRADASPAGSDADEPTEPAGRQPEGAAAATDDRPAETAPVDSAPGRHREPPRAGARPGEWEG